MFFRSAIDAWFYAFVVIFPLLLVRLALLLLSDANSTVIALGLCAVVPMLILPTWLLFGTYYRIDSTFLRVQAGPFTCVVPLEQIHDVMAVRSVGWAPALSCDRLKIIYGRSQSICLSPQRKATFLEALGYRPSAVLETSQQRPNPFTLGENY